MGSNFSHNSSSRTHVIGIKETFKVDLKRSRVHSYIISLKMDEIASVHFSS